jgi:hypothetical protein
MARRLAGTARSGGWRRIGLLRIDRRPGVYLLQALDDNPLPFAQAAVDDPVLAELTGCLKTLLSDLVVSAHDKDEFSLVVLLHGGHRDESALIRGRWLDDHADILSRQKKAFWIGKIGIDRNRARRRIDLIADEGKLSFLRT